MSEIEVQCYAGLVPMNALCGLGFAVGILM